MIKVIINKNIYSKAKEENTRPFGSHLAEAKIFERVSIDIPMSNYSGGGKVCAHSAQQASPYRFGRPGVKREGRI